MKSAGTGSGWRRSRPRTAPPDRDTHYLTAKPRMIRALRNADLVVAVGAELEAGWLPAAIRNAANPVIHPGRPGYFEAAAQVTLRNAGQTADRSQGDVHPAGNPHVQLDPVRMGKIARALAERLTRLDESGAALYRDRAQALDERLTGAMEDWQRQVRGSPGAVVYHKDMDYLLARLEVPVLGYVEPVPGVPPTARHIKALVDRLGDRPEGVILHRPYDSVDAVRRLASTLGCRTAALPLDPPLGAGADAYMALIEQYVQALRPE